MDRRTLLAIGLMLIIAVLPSVLFPPRRPPASATADTTGVAAESTVAPRPLDPLVEPERERAEARADSEALPPAREILVRSALYRMTFSTRGGRLTGATLLHYRSFARGDSGRAEVIPPDSRFLEFALVIGGDTVTLADWVFEPSATELDVGPGGDSLRLTARRGGADVELTYRFHSDRYTIDIAGVVHGIAGSGLVIVGLGPRLALVEADSVDDFRSYGVVTKASKTEVVSYRSLHPGQRRELSGPFEWVAVKSKYFVAAAMATTEGQPRFGGAVATGGPRDGRSATRADVALTLPAPGGRFGFSLYVGPQEYRRLKRIGHDFEDVNPYGWFLRPVIRPFTNLIVVILLWMHETLRLQYGWVLVVFGILVRVVLWPLNQKAMRSGVAMQAIQPELKAVQERYKQDPARMQQEVMKLYKEHGVNPLGGCLPMLIPMPVLFALFFVFRQTIEFRGVPFLWLPDLSRADPYYIIPVVMGLSMFALSKLGQRGVPPNPQTKMMLYFLPGMMTFFFLRLSSGLNLYYAVSNITSLPQQWLIGRERARRLGKT